MAEEKTFYECESPRVETKDHGMLDFAGKKEEEEKKPAHEEKEKEEEGIVSEHVSDPEPKAEEKTFYECENPVETKDRGMFDSTGKKDQERPAQEEEKEVDEVNDVPEFGKAHVSDPDPKVEEREEEEEEEKKQLDRPPSTDEEEEIEEKKNEKTGEDHKVDEPLDGGQEVEAQKKGFPEKIKEKLPGQQKKAAAAEEGLPAPAPPPLVADCLNSVKESQGGGQEGEAPKEGFLEKIKEKLPGQQKKATTEEANLPAPAPPPLVADCVDSVKESQGVGREGEVPKEGFLEKIKGKLTGCHHPKTTTTTSEDENKNYEVASN